MAELNLKFDKTIKPNEKDNIRKDLEGLILIVSPENARLKVRKKKENLYLIFPIKESASYDYVKPSNFIKGEGRNHISYREPNGNKYCFFKKRS